MSARIHRLRGLFDSAGIDALLITKQEDRRYISGFTGTSGYVIVGRDDSVLVTDFRYREQARVQASSFRIVEQDDVITALREQLKAMGAQRVGFEKHVLSYETAIEYQEKMDALTWVPCGRLVESLRRIKEESELKIIEEAAAIADTAFSQILEKLTPGITEIEVALELEFAMRKLGAASTSFDTIVASGKRSSLPHGVASDKPLEHGDFVTMDFGAYYKGYCSDLTRTICLGTASDRQREIYDVVLRAQRQAITDLRPGMTGVQGDAIARNIIREAGFGEAFGHGLGHGIGLEIHEGPRLSPRDETPLVPGMVVTVEPGIYIPDFGGVRIEDDVVITDTGCRVLTSSPKDLIELT